MVITRVDPEEVLERWQFDIQCENTGKDAATDDKQAPRFDIFSDLNHEQQFLSCEITWNIAYYLANEAN